MDFTEMIKLDTITATKNTKYYQVLWFKSFRKYNQEIYL